MTRSMDDQWDRIEANYSEMKEKLGEIMAVLATISKALTQLQIGGQSTTGVLHKESQTELLGDTLVVDTPEETKVLDEGKASFGDFPEGGQKNKTDVKCETHIVSEENDSSKTDVKLESTMDRDHSKKDSTFRRVTSVGAASVKASGLSAYARGDLYSSSIDKPPLEQQLSELEGVFKAKFDWKTDQQFLEKGCNSESERRMHAYKVGSTAVLKLSEDQDTEVGKLEINWKRRRRKKKHREDPSKGELSSPGGVGEHQLDGWMSCEEGAAEKDFGDQNNRLITTPLQAVSKLWYVYIGQEIHCYVTRNGLDSDIHVATSLLDKYVKNDLNIAEVVFESLEHRNIWASNSIVSGYSFNGDSEKSMKLVYQMKGGGIRSGIETYNSMVSGYSMAGRNNEALDMMMQTKGAGFANSTTTATLLKGWAGLFILQKQKERNEAIFLFHKKLQPDTKINLKGTHQSYDDVTWISRSTFVVQFPTINLEDKVGLKRDGIDMEHDKGDNGEDQGQ